MATLVRLHVDFNETDDDGNIETVAPPFTVLEGSVVQMFDADGHTCLGVVQRVSDALVAVKAAWDTWVFPLLAPPGTTGTVQIGTAPYQGNRGGSSFDSDVRHLVQA